MRSKKSTSFRLTAYAMQALEALSSHLGIDKSSVVEIAIRRLLTAEGIKLPQQPESDQEQ